MTTKVAPPRGFAEIAREIAEEIRLINEALDRKRAGVAPRAHVEREGQ